MRLKKINVLNEGDSPLTSLTLNLTIDVCIKLMFGLVWSKKLHSDNHLQVQVQFEGNKFIQNSKSFQNQKKPFMI